jgi:P-type conjugative transfer protein TrbL
MIANFQASGTAWEPIFQRIAMRIFFFLAVVQIAIELGVMAAKGELEIGGVAVTLGRMMLIFGIFWAALQAPTYFLQWFNGFDSLANSANAAAGAGGSLSVGRMFGASADLLGYGVSNLSVWDVGKSLGILFISLVATVLIVLIAVEFIILTLKFYFLMYINIIILAFAPFTHTRQWAINGVTNLLKAGLEVLMIKLIIGLTITAILKYVDDAIAGEDTSLVYLLIFIIAVFALSKMIHPMVESFFSGYSAQNNNMGQRMVQAGLTSATGSIGMGMNAASTTKTQTQALQASKTSSSSGSATQTSSSGGGGGTPDMNTPISSSLTLGSAMQGAAKVSMGVAGAAAGVASAMGKEALGINTGGNAANSSSNPSSEHNKKFPSEYKPSDKK